MNDSAGHHRCLRHHRRLLAGYDGNGSTLACSGVDSDDGCVLTCCPPRPCTAKARQGVAPLPFELVVLEVALGDVCNVLQRLTKELELLAHPALEALTRDVRPPAAQALYR